MLKVVLPDVFYNKLDDNTLVVVYFKQTVNDILGRKRKDTFINELKFENNTISSPQEIANNSFNNYFSNIGRNIANSNSDSNSSGETFDRYMYL